MLFSGTVSLLDLHTHTHGSNTVDSTPYQTRKGLNGYSSHDANKKVVTTSLVFVHFKQVPSLQLHPAIIMQVKSMLPFDIGTCT